MNQNIYWIPRSGDGRLGIMARPHGDDWLEDEVASLRRAGVDAIICLLTYDEVCELGLEREEECCGQYGIAYVPFSIEDRGVPGSKPRTRELTKQIQRFLADGKSAVVHCRAGIGRAALIAACVLVAEGLSADFVLELIASARGREVPDTLEQAEWIGAFAGFDA